MPPPPLRGGPRVLRGLSGLHDPLAIARRFATRSAPTAAAPYLPDRVHAPLACGAPDEPLLKDILLSLTSGENAPEGHCAGWLQAHGGSLARASDGIHLTPVFGGITNQLFRADFGAVAVADNRENEEATAPAPLLIRLFGGVGMIDREVENAAFAGLAEAGVGVPFHGRFGNGRVEGWLEGAKSLELEQMSDAAVCVGVAQELAKLHAFELPSPKGDSQKQPSMWPQLWSWLRQAQDTCHEIEVRWGANVAARFGDIHSRLLGTLGHGAGETNWKLDRAEAELVELEREMALSPIVFAHNDALAGNIMLDENTGAVTLIDFEYGGYNYRGFDIANHWNEWAGGTQAEMNGRCEYKRFPSAEQRYAFAESYLRQETKLKAEALMQTGLFNDGGGANAEEDNAVFLENVVASAVDDAAVQSLVEEANSFVQINHWYWGLWAINQTITEGVDEFDYLTYAESRVQRYFDEKGGERTEF